jgi:hypothetical protein
MWGRASRNSTTVDTRNLSAPFPFGEKTPYYELAHVANSGAVAVEISAVPLLQQCREGRADEAYY